MMMMQKAKSEDLLIQIGWHDENIFDLGDITGARATEAYDAYLVKTVGNYEDWQI